MRKFEGRRGEGNRTCLQDRDPTWHRPCEGDQGHCSGQVRETGVCDGTEAGTPDLLILGYPLAMRLDLIKHRLITSVLLGSGRAFLPMKTSSSVVWSRGLSFLEYGLLLPAGQPFCPQTFSE